MIEFVWQVKVMRMRKVNETWVDVHMLSQIGRLVYKIELRIQIDNEDFMHDTNQYEFKMDG